MALRGTLTHRKTRRLAKLLGIAPCFALGILEALWHTTSEQTPCGDIGRMANQDIADELFYEGDADALIAALVDAGWLDKDPKHRLVVHDWDQHADQSTKRKVARAGCTFTSHDESQLVMPSPPEPVPETDNSIPTESLGVQGETKTPRKAPGRFAPPTQEEAIAYFRELGSSPLEASRYRDWFESNGWRVGRNPMKDWRAAARNWVSRSNGAPPGTSPPRPARRVLTPAELELVQR